MVNSQFGNFKVPIITFLVKTHVLQRCDTRATGEISRGQPSIPRGFIVRFIEKVLIQKKTRLMLIYV